MEESVKHRFSKNWHQGINTESWTCTNKINTCKASQKLVRTRLIVFNRQQVHQKTKKYTNIRCADKQTITFKNNTTF